MRRPRPVTDFAGDRLMSCLSVRLRDCLVADSADFPARVNQGTVHVGLECRSAIMSQFPKSLWDQIPAGQDQQATQDYKQEQ